MGRLDGNVVFITGVARGQGRSHAVRLAEEGAAIIGVDICADIDTVPYGMATKSDLDETVRLVEARGGKIHAQPADVRDLSALEAAVTCGISRFGRLDAVVANACTVNGVGPAWELSEEQWNDQIEVGLTGTWKTMKATIPHLIKQGSGGSIVLISSTAGLAYDLNLAHYTAAKSGVTGLMRELSAELAPYSIRVNSVHPANVRSPMTENQTITELFAGGRAGAQFDDGDVVAAFQDLAALPIPYLDPIDISNAVLHLLSEEARYVTGTTHVVDLGSLLPYKAPLRR